MADDGAAASPEDTSSPSADDGGPVLQDRPLAFPVAAHEDIFRGRVWDIVADDVVLPTGVVRREYVDHPGAVAVIALDEQGRVLLLSQYRHPVRMELWEPPAGLLDVDGEAPLETARRELAEEADLVAEHWEHLVSFRSSPGGSSEEISVFLARGLSPVPAAERHERTEEEAGMVPVWLPLADAVAAVLDGRLHSPTAVVGVLAAWTTAALPAS